MPVDVLETIRTMFMSYQVPTQSKLFYIVEFTIFNVWKLWMRWATWSAGCRSRHGL